MRVTRDAVVDMTIFIVGIVYVVVSFHLGHLTDVVIASVCLLAGTLSRALIIWRRRRSDEGN